MRRLMAAKSKPLINPIPANLKPIPLYSPMRSQGGSRSLSLRRSMMGRRVASPIAMTLTAKFCVVMKVTETQVRATHMKSGTALAGSRWAMLAIMALRTWITPPPSLSAPLLRPRAPKARFVMARPRVRATPTLTRVIIPSIPMNRDRVVVAMSSAKAIPCKALPLAFMVIAPPFGPSSTGIDPPDQFLR
jgi:hypothetical protein